MLLILDKDIVIFGLYFYGLAFCHLVDGIWHGHALYLGIDADRVELLVDIMDVIVIRFLADDVEHL